MPQAILIKGEVVRNVKTADGEPYTAPEGHVLLTPATLKSAHSGVVAELTGEARAEERQAFAARVKELSEALPDDPAAVLDALAKGMSAAEAKAARYEQLAAELKAEREAHAKTTAKLEKVKATGLPFAASDAEDEEGEEPEAPDALSDEALEAEYNRRADLRAEFPTLASYKGFRRAAAADLVVTSSGLHVDD